MPLARSRLLPPTSSSPNLPAQPTPSQTQLPDKPPRSRTGHSLAARYAAHLPTLILAIPGWVLLWWILTTIYPDQIRNFIFPNSFLPVVVSLWWSSWFTVSFFLLKTRRGLAVSTFFTLIVWLKLQHIVTSVPVLLVLASGCFIPLCLVEVIARLRSSR